MEMIILWYIPIQHAELPTWYILHSAPALTSARSNSPLELNTSSHLLARRLGHAHPLSPPGGWTVDSPQFDPMVKELPKTAIWMGRRAASAAESTPAILSASRRAAWDLPRRKPDSRRRTVRTDRLIRLNSATVALACRSSSARVRVDDLV